MPYETDDTIAAIASAAGGAARGVVRMSGPDVVMQLAACFTPAAGMPQLSAVRELRRIAGTFHVDGVDGGECQAIPGKLLLWPSTRSYTRQPAAEFHTIGSPPLLAAIVEGLGRAGIRAAEPGEFTLRAFLAGRVDLTQAEGVLGVIDARDRGDLDAALDQLAGGLSRPLHRLREELLAVLAELEAGLDFVEEDIEFISREALRGRLQATQGGVANAIGQMAQRDHRNEAPRIALVGLPNAGKSSLFNALLARYGASTVTTVASAIVSAEPGATRDYLLGRVRLGAVDCELIDTAGEVDATGDELHVAAQQATMRQRREAVVRVRCIDGSAGLVATVPSIGEVIAFTKSDLTGAVGGACSEPSVGAGGENSIRCSSVTGVGIDELARRLSELVQSLADDGAGDGATAATSARCAGSLRAAARSLAAAEELIDVGRDELVAAEIRAALDALGEVVGAVCADDVLDRVFGQFCIGK